MFLTRCFGWMMLLSLLASGGAWAQASTAPEPQGFLSQGDLDVDFLFNYYEQDGDNSPVTGGEGTEEMDVLTPVILLRYRVNENWQLSADLGLDAITSASTDNIDDNVSSASRVDNRGHAVITATRQMENQTFGFSAGFSTEYDYQSVNGGLHWSRDFRQKTSTLAASVRHFSDTVELYDIDGIVQGEDDRTTTDLSLSWTQILSPRAVGAVELYVSDQSGFLSTPFHEVILQPDPAHPDGLRIAERLPDSRRRTALGLRLNVSLSKNIVQRAYVRAYDDDWGITAQTLELETHFRLPGSREQWIFPILRYHTQDASDYFGLPRTFTGTEDFFTADRDLSEFDSEKFGLGYRVILNKGRFRGFETRISSYSRDDGLDALSASLAFQWRF